ncbi:DegT/DnrJ/EryC1/StrS family aminotransferase [Roseivirga sp. BDSF3-8]|uniref:DegT/DnrJ/EryC1/StrS family aminotransferase n=1 Tax=Roseivirga sp. BDSF3-8 TaxID=3241598 RepID=UPI00353253ED
MIRVFSSKAGVEELEHVRQSIENQWLGGGPKLKQFEDSMASDLSTQYFTMIDNATNGLFLACQLLGLEPGSEIICPSFTWVGCAHAIKLAGFEPVFCDVAIESQNVSVETIKPKITRKTSAIMVVHYAGLSVDMNPIIELGYPIIEDAAHAVCSTYKGRRCGTLGKIGVFSFDSMKNLAVGEGGGIAFSSEEHFERAKKLRLCGLGKSSYEMRGNKDRWWELGAREASLKFKPSDISAGVALGQLAKLPVLQQRRKEVWTRYHLELANINELHLPIEKEFDNSQHSYFTYTIRTPKRDQLANFLLSEDIYTTLRFFPIHLNEVYMNGLMLENTEILKETALNIPLHPNMEEQEVDKVISSIKKFFDTAN